MTEARPAELSPSEPQREEGHFLLSFAGDCTLGTEHGSWGKSGTFPEVVGEDYAYPFAGVQSLFAQDDFTFVNLEGALTSHTVPAEKQYRFRGPTAYGAILTEGSVEAVTLANNHTLDYGKTGLQETRQVLKDLGVAAGGDGETFLYTTSQGLKIGVYTAYHFGKPQIRQSIETLQSQGRRSSSLPFTLAPKGPILLLLARRTCSATLLTAGPTSSTTAIPMCSSPWSATGTA